LLRFNESDHTYWWGEEYVPGVNSIFRDLGLIDTTFMSEDGAARGKRRHRLLEAHIQSKVVDWSDEDHFILFGWEEFAADFGVHVEYQELPLYHSLAHYAGTPDMAGELAGEKWIIDFKMSASAYPWHQLQTALYRLADADTFSSDLRRGGTVYFRPGKKRNYRFVPHDDSSLESALSVVETYHWKHKEFDAVEDMRKIKVQWLDALAEELGQAVS